MFSKNSANVLSADSSSNSIATVKNSSRFSILVSASTLFSFSKAFVYPVLLRVSLIKSDILSSSFFDFKYSICSIKSLEFENTLVNPYSCAFLIISYIELPVLSEIS